MNIWEQRTDWGLIRRNEDLILEEISLLKPTSILEVGCGNGNWAPILSNYGNYLGTDISRNSINICRKNFPELKFKVEAVEGLKETGWDLLFGYTVIQLVPPERMDRAIRGMKAAAKWGLLVEPTGFTSNRYCFCHDYENLFDVKRKIKLPDQNFSHIYIIKLN